MITRVTTILLAFVSILDRSDACTGSAIPSSAQGLDGGGSSRSTGPQGRSAVGNNGARADGGGNSQIPDLGAKPGGQDFISSASDLNCFEWELDCRWRNEPDGPGRDLLSWGRGTGVWDTARGNIGFGTVLKPSGKWLITGAGNKRPISDNAMLVSDPVPCQPQNGEISFRFWTTPGARVRTCTREPDGGANYIFCSPYASTGDPGPAVVNIPPSNRPFEIVIEGSGFNFDRFGIKGGGIIIDDLAYTTGGSLNSCSTRQRQTDTPRTTTQASTTKRRETDPPTRRTTQSRRDTQPREDTSAVCEKLACTFDGGPCSQRVGNGWTIDQGPHGNRHTGVRQGQNGGYAVIDGPDDASFTTDSFTLDSDKLMAFCYYRPAALSALTIEAVRNGRTEKLFESPVFDRNNQHAWLCDQALLESGNYEKIEYIATGLGTKFASLAIDNVDLFNVDNAVESIC